LTIKKGIGIIQYLCISYLTGYTIFVLIGIFNLEFLKVVNLIYPILTCNQYINLKKKWHIPSTLFQIVAIGGIRILKAYLLLVGIQPDHLIQFKGINPDIGLM